MARAAKELGPQVAKFKLERHGMKLTQAEELAIARVHQTLTIAMADLRRTIAAIAAAKMSSPYTREMICEQLRDAIRTIEDGRPYALCIACRREPAAMASCKYCSGTGWLLKGAFDMARLDVPEPQ